MTALEVLQLIVFFGALIIGARLLGGYMARIYEGQPVWLTPVLRPVETAIYRLGGIEPSGEMTWRAYALALLAFNVLGFVVVFVMQLVQAALPLNPAGLGNVEITSAFNTATSFMTNTNWQGYAGEITMSYATQMLGLAVQNFVSAATGMAVVIAFTRGLVRKTAQTLGNFWSDLTRSILYILLPLSIVLAVGLAGQGVIQNFSAPVEALTLSGEIQTLPQGPAASQVAIKQLGTNGGGFFNANSAHPYENPTPVSGFVQMLSILLIPAAMTVMYGIMTGNIRQGWVIFAAMLALLLVGLSIMLFGEYSANPFMPSLAPIMEGKEVRFGIMNSVLWANVTTAASNGSVNAMISSMNPLTGGMALLNIMLGEVVFGGVGAGLYGMLIFVLLTVFIAGLMVGRTPEYLGKKVEAREVRLAILAVLLPSASILIGAAIASSIDLGLSSRANSGPHGISEILYAFSSASGNNGSAFAGLNANTPFYNIALGLCMWIGRFGVILPVLAIAGGMAGKKVAPPSSGTFPTDGPLFAAMLVAVIVIVGALTFFPALSLGPIVEQLLLK
ncbi:MAG: potassium-transporting ATPase subunit KdpA [Chloroflexi bacterium]|nr:potassium-transporting ATPase subunit KdpA [Chloroflexota bacterium]